MRAVMSLTPPAAGPHQTPNLRGTEEALHPQGSPLLLLGTICPPPRTEEIKSHLSPLELFGPNPVENVYSRQLPSNRPPGKGL